MKKILFVTLLCYTIAQDQDRFPLVTVEDQPGMIPLGISKIYRTTLTLRRKLSSSSFVEETFVNSMIGQYNKLEGFVVLRNIQDNRINDDDVQVTYEAQYSYVPLAENNRNEDVIDTIGNYATLRNFLINSGSTLNDFFTISNEDSFSFRGDPLCNTNLEEGSVCSGNLICTEVLEGVNITCQSECKLGFCLNNGTCEQSDVNTAPVCTCPSTSNSWYLGARCEFFIALWMIVVGIVCCVILIAVVLIVSCWLYRMKKRRKEKEALAEISGETNNAFVNDEDKISIIKKPEPRKENDTLVYTVNDQARRHRDSSAYSRRSRRSSYSRKGKSRERSYRRKEEPQIETVSKSVGRSQTELKVSDVSSVSSESANDVSVAEKGTSPVIWRVPKESPLPRPNKKFDIAARKGWKPSLGPHMFNLGSQLTGIAETNSENSFISDTESSEASDETQGVEASDSVEIRKV